MRVLALLSILVSAAVTLTGQTKPGAGRLIAIGDIHGAYNEFVTILRRAGLVDDTLAWSGGSATLVQTGDYTDRGTGVRQVLDLLMRLERQAKSSGGRVVILLGNHEIMNLMGDWRDVTPEICATFATATSEKTREDAYRQYTRLSPRTTPPAATYGQTREAWMSANPPGCLEYREAMSASGTYGKWLREKPIAAQIAGTLFMHAGINPAKPTPKSVDEVIDKARAEVRRLDAFRERLVSRKLALPSFDLQQVLDVSVAELRSASAAVAAAKAEGQPAPDLDVPLLREAQELMDVAHWSLIDPEGPLWFRGYAQWTEPEYSAQVFEFLDSMKLTRIVVGHTVTPTRRITPRFGGRVVLIDTGMLSVAYKGTPSALELTGGSLKAFYPTGEEVLTASPANPPQRDPSH